MDYRIAICDDEETQRAYISALVRSWAEQSDHTVELELFGSAEEFLFHYEEQNNYDILLLDIEMDRIDGITLAKRVRAENEAVQIIFITGYSEYIAEGYEVAALHYLMKPVDREKLLTVLDRAVQKLRKNGRFLTLSLSGETVRVPIYEIRYLDVRQNYVTIHAKKDYTLKKSLGEFEPSLDERFFRIGRSCILNLTCIQRVTKTDVYLTDGTVLPLPRGMYEPLNRAIITRM